MNRRLIIISIIGAFILMPAFAGAGDVEDLQAAFEKQIKDMGELNAESYLAGIHDQWAGAGYMNIFVNSGQKAAVREMVQNGWPNLESLQLSINYVEYRVVGNVGIAYGIGAWTYKFKNEPTKGASIRFLNTYIKEKGKWLLLTNSDAPLSVGRAGVD